MTDGERTRSSGGLLSRRALVVGAAAAGGAWLASGPIRRWLASDFDFQPVDDPPGFRRLTAGATSGSIDPFVGLRAPAAAGTDPGELRSRLCEALFGPEPPAPGVVPSHPSPTTTAPIAAS